MKSGTNWLALSGLLFLAGCAPKAAPTASRSTTASAFSEDLGAYRPRYVPAPPSAAPPARPAAPEKRPAPVATPEQPLHVTRRLDMVLDTLAMRNKYVKHARGYRIQLYVGNSRQEADEVKIYVYQNFPELNVYLSYSAPTYRLRAGDFINRLDVERYFEALKTPYPNAMIQTDKVEIRKSLLIK